MQLGRGRKLKAGEKIVAVTKGAFFAAFPRKVTSSLQLHAAHLLWYVRLRVSGRGVDSIPQLLTTTCHVCLLIESETRTTGKKRPSHKNDFRFVKLLFVCESGGGQRHLPALFPGVRGTSARRSISTLILLIRNQQS